MGIADLFAGRSLEGALKRARQRLAAGEFGDALRIVESGLQRFPEAEALREIGLTIRRVQARSGMQDLKRRIASANDPVAHEQLIRLYLDVNMFNEALRGARVYLEAHPRRDTPHILLGEMYLQTFFEGLQARDAHMAHDHLLRAARLNQDATKPRLLLAELYYCAGARKALHVVGGALQRIASNDPSILQVIEVIAAAGDAQASESVDGLFAQVEVDGQLLREPTTWPLSNRRNRDAQLMENRTMKIVKQLIRDASADEIVVLRRNGSPLVHAAHIANEEGKSSGRRQVTFHDLEGSESTGLTGVAAAVAETISKQAREFDMGQFKRCAIQGPFGHVIVGRVSNVIAGMHRKSRSGEATRLWERVAVRLDNASTEGTAS